eukprot:EG_transcript_5925
MTEDLAEIGEHIFDAAVNNMAAPQSLLPNLTLPLAPQSFQAPPLTFLPPQYAHYQTTLRSIKKPLDKYLYLMDLRERDLNALYSLLQADLPGTLPYIYTPTVGEACEKFDTLFQTRPIPGLYIRSTDRGHVRHLLEAWGREVDIVVMTDGSRILGLGDLGANGMGIPIGKLQLYSAAAGFDPRRTLPLTLDVGTDNTALRQRTTYQGLRQPRVAEAEYLALLDEVVAAAARRWPRAVLQFEDFASPHCFALLARYRHTARAFNDDIQGTGAVIAAGFLNAVKISGVPLPEQRIVLFGAGAAGQGVADTIKAAMVRNGMTEAQAKNCFYFVDSKGLVTTARPGPLETHKASYARSDMPPTTSLLAVVQAVQPTALIGLSAVPDAFTKPVVTAMAKSSRRPIIFALSNPTSKSELAASKAIRWTKGRVVFAAGSPYAPVAYRGRTYPIAQGNNVYVFPGLGLGAFLSQAAEVSDAMVVAAAQALAATVSEAHRKDGFIYPALSSIRKVSTQVAAAVMEQARKDGLARLAWPGDTLQFVQGHMWEPSM